MLYPPFLTAIPYARRAVTPTHVIAGLVPATRARRRRSKRASGDHDQRLRAWVAGTSPAMTSGGGSIFAGRLADACPRTLNSEEPAGSDGQDRSFEPRRGARGGPDATGQAQRARFRDAGRSDRGLSGAAGGGRAGHRHPRRGAGVLRGTRLARARRRPGWGCVDRDHAARDRALSAPGGGGRARRRHRWRQRARAALRLRDRQRDGPVRHVAGQDRPRALLVPRPEAAGGGRSGRRARDADAGRPAARHSDGGPRADPPRRPAPAARERRDRPDRAAGGQRALVAARDESGAGAGDGVPRGRAARGRRRPSGRRLGQRRRPRGNRRDARAPVAPVRGSVMGVRLEKPWRALTAENVAGLAGELGVYQLGDVEGRVVRIGYAGGRTLFGLRSELEAALAKGEAAQFRTEVTA